MTVEIERTLGEGFYNKDGRFIPGDFVVRNINASIQPLSGRQIQLLPEGRRSEDSIVIYSTEELFTAQSSANKKGDVVIFRGKRYEVFNTKAWLSGAFTNYESIALLESK